jgi:hypothetical protein
MIGRIVKPGRLREIPAYMEFWFRDPTGRHALFADVSRTFRGLCERC